MQTVSAGVGTSFADSILHEINHRANQHPAILLLSSVQVSFKNYLKTSIHHTVFLLLHDTSILLEPKKLKLEMNLIHDFWKMWIQTFHKLSSFSIRFLRYHSQSIA